MNFGLYTGIGKGTLDAELPAFIKEPKSIRLPILNWDASEGVASWVIETGGLQVLSVDGYLSPAPNFDYFQSTATASTICSQYINLIDAGVSAYDIDNFEIEVVLYAYTSGYYGDTDNTALGLRALNSAGVAIGSDTYSIGYDSDTFTLRREVFTLPALTRAVKILFKLTRTGGTNNDAKFIMPYAYARRCVKL